MHCHRNSSWRITPSAQSALRADAAGGDPAAIGALGRHECNRPVRSGATPSQTTKPSGEKRTEVRRFAQLPEACRFGRQRVVVRKPKAPPTDITPGAELEADSLVDAERSEADRLM
jgi:hypothetical protein